MNDQTSPLLDQHQQVTFAFVFAIAVIALTYDVLIVWRWGTSASISWTLAIVARRWPIVSFLCAIVMGHVFLIRWAPNLIAVDNIFGLAVLVGGLALGAVLAPQSAGKPDRIPKNQRGDETDSEHGP